MATESHLRSGRLSLGPQSSDGLFSGAAHPGAHEHWRAQEGARLAVAGPWWLCSTLGSVVGGGRGFCSQIPGPGTRPPWVCPEPPHTRG